MSLSFLRRLFGYAAVAAFVFTAGPSAASNLLPAIARSDTPLVVSDDRGGFIVDRARQVQDLRQSGRDVRIVGSICHSACTMLIGLPHACVSPKTVFGFHGPSMAGRPLDRDRFERASYFIAAHYPESLSRWYMNTGRFRTAGLYEFTGSDLIAMGVRRCV